MAGSASRCASSTAGCGCAMERLGVKSNTAIWRRGLALTVMIDEYHIEGSGKQCEKGKVVGMMI